MSHTTSDTCGGCCVSLVSVPRSQPSAHESRTRPLSRRSEPRRGQPLKKSARRAPSHCPDRRKRFYAATRSPKDLGTERSDSGHQVLVSARSPLCDQHPDGFPGAAADWAVLQHPRRELQVAAYRLVCPQPASPCWAAPADHMGQTQRSQVRPSTSSGGFRRRYCLCSASWLLAGTESCGAGLVAHQVLRTREQYSRRHPRPLAGCLQRSENKTEAAWFAEEFLSACRPTPQMIQVFHFVREGQ